MNYRHLAKHLRNNNMNVSNYYQPITRWQILDSSKLTEFADDYFKLDENGRKLSKQVENTVGKGKIARYEPISPFPSVFKRLVSQGRQKVWLCGNGLTLCDKFIISRPWKRLFSKPLCKNMETHETCILSILCTYLKPYSSFETHLISNLKMQPQWTS